MRADLPGEVVVDAEHDRLPADHARGERGRRRGEIEEQLGPDAPAHRDGVGRETRRDGLHTAGRIQVFPRRW
jgi:hypothetical protein